MKRGSRIVGYVRCSSPPLRAHTPASSCVSFRWRRLQDKGFRGLGHWPWWRVVVIAALCGSLHALSITCPSFIIFTKKQLNWLLSHGCSVQLFFFTFLLLLEHLQGKRYKEETVESKTTNSGCKTLRENKLYGIVWWVTDSPPLPLTTL